MRNKLHDTGITQFNNLQLKVQLKCAPEMKPYRFYQYGQLWVKDSDPDELYFTTNTGDDIQITNGTSLAGGGDGSLSVTTNNNDVTVYPVFVDGVTTNESAEVDTDLSDPSNVH